MRITARAVAQRLNADLSDHGGPWLPCSDLAKVWAKQRHEELDEGGMDALASKLPLRHTLSCRDDDTGAEFRNRRRLSAV